MSISVRNGAGTGVTNVATVTLADGSTALAHVVVGTDGNPIVPASDSSIQALGTAISAFARGVVDKTTNQSIGGTKNFTGAMTVPVMPANDSSHAPAATSVVDAKIAAAAGTSVLSLTSALPQTIAGPAASSKFLAAATGSTDTSAYASFLDGTAAPRPTNFAARISGAIDIPFPAVVGINTIYPATASITNGSPTATLSAAPPAGVTLVGQAISGTGIQSGTTILSASGTTLTLSKVATATNSTAAVSIQQPAGYQAHIQYAQSLIQGVTTKGNGAQESALVVNLISETGAGPQTNWSAKVGFYCCVVMRPGSANTWAENPDLCIQPGVGYQCGYLRESDLTNFNGPYTPGGGGYGTACHDFRTLTGFPVTASELWSGQTPNDGSGNGSSGGTVSATLNGTNTISFGSATTNGLSVGDMVAGTGIPGYTYINSITPSGGSSSTTAVNVTSGTAVLSNAATISGSSTLTVTTYSMFYGINPSGPTLIRDAFIVDGSNSRVSYQLFGTHLTGVDTASATLSYALAMAAGQKVSFNGLDASLSYSGGALTYSVGGATPLAVYRATGAVNGIGITPAGTGYGPTIAPQGSDANVPLNLSGKGTGPVQVLGALVVSGQTTFGGMAIEASCTVATTPIGYPAGRVYVSNARKVGEAAGAGTGVPAYYSNGAWRRLSDDTAVAA